MIKVWKENDDFRFGFAIEGHALSAPRGEDIICAGVSTLAQAIQQALYKFSYVRSESGDGYMRVIIYEPTSESNILTWTFENAIKQLTQQYPKHIQIMKGERSNEQE